MSSDEKRSAANRRGRAYRCRHCMRQGRPDFVAEKFRVESHVYKHHIPLDRVPFSCKTCMFRSTTMAQFRKHLTSYSWHRQRGGSPSAGNDSLCKSTNPHYIGDEDWEVLSKDRSIEFFVSRSRQSSTSPAPPEGSAGEDMLQRAMRASGLKETESQELVELTIYAEVGDQEEEESALDLNGRGAAQEAEEGPIDLRVVCVKARKESTGAKEADRVETLAERTEARTVDVREKVGEAEDGEATGVVTGADGATAVEKTSGTAGVMAARARAEETKEMTAESATDAVLDIFPALAGLDEEQRIPTSPARRRPSSISSSSSSSSSSSTSSTSSQQNRLVEALAGLVKRSSDMVQYSVDRTMEMVEKLNRTIEGQREELQRFAMLVKSREMGIVRNWREAGCQTEERGDGSEIGKGWRNVEGRGRERHGENSKDEEVRQHGRRQTEELREGSRRQQRREENQARESHLRRSDNEGTKEQGRRRQTEDVREDEERQRRREEERERDRRQRKNGEEEMRERGRRRRSEEYRERQRTWREMEESSGRQVRRGDINEGRERRRSEENTGRSCRREDRDRSGSSSRERWNKYRAERR